MTQHLVVHVIVTMAGVDQHQPWRDANRKTVLSSQALIFFVVVFLQGSHKVPVQAT